MPTVDKIIETVPKITSEVINSIDKTFSLPIFDPSSIN